jgi:lipooligosaccharide transport system permease protein
MTVSFLESTYGNFSKLNYQKTYASMVQTPLEPNDVVLGEALWGASKGTISAIGVAVIISVFGHIEILMLPLALIIIFLSSFIFSLIGMYVIAVVKNYDGIIYPTCGFIVPMSVLCGTYFPLEQLPSLFRYFLFLFPLTHTVAAVRGIFLGGVPWWQYVIHLVYLLGLSFFLLEIANKKIEKKLIN